MTRLVIENKSYIVVPESEYFELQKKAALKVKGDAVLTIEKARAHSIKKINQWAKEKSE